MVAAAENHTSGLHDDVLRHIATLTDASTLKALSEASKDWRHFSCPAVEHLSPTSWHDGSISRLAERFPRLKSLDLKRFLAFGSAPILSEMQSLRCLEHLSLDCCKGIQDSDIAQLASATSLTSLSLRNCSQVTLGGLQPLTALASLAHLNIAGIKLNTAGLLPGAPAAAGGPGLAPPLDSQLQEGHASGCGVTALLRRLETLTVGDGHLLSFVADALMLGLARSRPQRLTGLDLSGCIDLTDTAMLGVSQLPSLQRLSLQSCVRLTNNSLALLTAPPPNGSASGAACGQLLSLNLRGCLQLSDAGLGCLLAAKQLRELNLRGCTAVTGSVLASLLPALPHMRTLNLSHCSSLASLEPLAAGATSGTTTTASGNAAASPCPGHGLSRLDVGHCAKLSLASLAPLSALTALTRLDAQHLRANAPGAGAAGLSAEQLDAQLARLSALGRLASLDLSHSAAAGVAHPPGGGLPAGLLAALGAMTALTRLALAGCGPRAAAPAPPQAAPAAAAPEDAAAAASPLCFLAGLRPSLRELDLSDWQGLDPVQLRWLAGAGALRCLDLSRAANMHGACAGGCSVHGCECGAGGGANADGAPSAVWVGSAAASSCASSSGSPAKPSHASRSHSDGSSECCLELEGAVSGLGQRLAAVGLGDGGGGIMAHLGLPHVGARAGSSSRRGSGLDEALAQLAGLPALEELRLEACSQLTDVGVLHLAALPALERLYLGGCSRVAGLTLGALARPGPSTPAYPHPLPPSPGVRTLALVNCAALTDAGALALASVTSLRSLDLGGCARLTDLGCGALARGLTGLTRLVLRGVSRLGGSGGEGGDGESGGALRALAALPRLRELSLAQCGGVGEEGLAALLLAPGAAPRLAVLDVTHCWRLGRARLAATQAARPALSLQYTGRR